MVGISAGVIKGMPKITVRLIKVLFTRWQEYDRD